MGLESMIVGLAAAMFASTASDLVAPEEATNGLTPRLWCAVGDTGDFSVRRMSLMAWPGVQGEVGLTAGHGLHAGQSCELRVGDERVEAHVATGQFTNQPGRDWAIVRSSRRLTQSVDRFSPAIAADQEFSGQIKLNGSRSLRCDVFPAPERYDYGDQVLLHDCASVPGRSGAPLIASADGRSVVVGVNLGWLYDAQADKDARVFGYMRRIDQEIADALERTASH